MKEKILDYYTKNILAITFVIATFFGVFMGYIFTREYKDEQIKILEQSLNEQIQEKQVYMKMVESEGKE